MYQMFYKSHCVQIIWTNEPLRGVSCFPMLITSTLMRQITQLEVYVRTLQPVTCTTNLVRLEQ